MLNVALTGNIASGKSTVAAVWRARGAYIIDSDELSRLVVAPGGEALPRIAERWGSGVILPSGELNRTALRDIVFRDPEERAWLESLLHPLIGRIREEMVAAAAEAGREVVVSDVPLLFETGLEKGFDLVVLVDAPEAVRRERLITLRGVAPAQADRMIAAQLPSRIKRDRADLIINNHGSLPELEEQAARIWTTIELRSEVEARG
ncbi:MAG: dephospho-CoA kinase [Gemmatimonadota bacterium]|jgi:dephospho-CoA kinase|nr:dephospho-CoA kinase [Gemmatimonadota bacterium]